MYRTYKDGNKSRQTYDVGKNSQTNAYVQCTLHKVENNTQPNEAEQVIIRKHKKYRGKGEPWWAPRAPIPVFPVVSTPAESASTAIMAGILESRPHFRIIYARAMPKKKLI